MHVYQHTSYTHTCEEPIYPKGRFPTSNSKFLIYDSNVYTNVQPIIALQSTKHNVILQCALPLHAVVSCLAKFNDLPAKPANGQKNVSGVTFGSTVTYSCDAGYKLIGPSTVTCLANRRWNTSGDAVHCIGKSKCMYIVYYYNNIINITELL